MEAKMHNDEMYEHRKEGGVEAVDEEGGVENGCSVRM
jgi:hypothetical protein